MSTIEGFHCISLLPVYNFSVQWSNSHGILIKQGLTISSSSIYLQYSGTEASYPSVECNPGQEAEALARWSLAPPPGERPAPSGLQQGLVIWSGERGRFALHCPPGVARLPELFFQQRCRALISRGQFFHR